jgi:hypothetical protein
MATNMILKDRNGETVYPSTMTRYVYNDAGVDLDALLEDKVSKQPGKGLSQEDFTSGLKEKLDALPTNEELGNSLADKQGVLALTEDLIFGTDGKLGLTELAKKRLFIDLWNATYNKPKFIGYDKERDLFFIKTTFLGISFGLDDITYDEALRIYNRTFSSVIYPYNTANIRVNIPPYNYANPFSVGKILLFHANMEYLFISESPTAYCSSVEDITNCPKLKAIIGAISISRKFNLTMLPKLQYVFFRISGSTKPEVNIKDSPLLERASLQWSIDNSVDAGATVTVHPDVYAKLTGDTTNEAAAALTPEELAQWQQLMVDAADKHVIFATV